ncbi:MAG TPA: hypothetical protein ENH99_03075 [Candidatus Pacearchaeota archaeon]|nr:hypothetical protein [Candidatus Pacearchaeota archaeon]
MRRLHLIGKQVLILFVLSVLISIAMIIHGIFFDLDFEQIKRLTLEGLVITLLVIFPTVLFLEWVFDLNNRKRFEGIEKKLKRLK